MTPKEALEFIDEHLYEPNCEEQFEIVETALNRLEELEKVLEIIKETWGDSILTDIEKGFILGCPYTEMPNKEKCSLLKEYLK